MFDIYAIESFVENLSNNLWGTPFVVFIVLAGTLLTLSLNFAQIKYFFTGWKYIFEKEESQIDQKKNISTFQAFVNALSSSLGNGGLVGMATVLVGGGPGSAFWVFILGFFSMILRFSEVYASLIFKTTDNSLIGPLAYISKIPFGRFWVYVYSIFMLIYVFCGGIAMQCNSMGIGLRSFTGISTNIIGVIFALLVFYILIGGAKRIMRAAEFIIPIKVGLFFIGIIILLVYHYDKIFLALKIVLDNAFTIDSFAAGSTAFTMQKAISIGFARALNATEAGVGTASIFFGSTESKNPLKKATVSMITAFISTNLVCATLLFGIVVTGISTQGLVSTEIVIESFKTVFGFLAGPAITFLSLSFGIGVMVAYSFLGYTMWEFLFGKKTIFLYIIIMPLIALFGTIVKVNLVWYSMDSVVWVLIVINLFGVLFNIKKIRRCFLKDSNESKI
jgi:AGCS family alanine or glycine:cation symporter